MEHVSADQRRARLALRHHVAPSTRAKSVVDVARDLVGIHATDPASVYLAASARLRDFSVAAVERALYDKRSVVRILGMRRTMFVVPDELAPVIHAAATKAVFTTERQRVVKMVEEAGIAKDGARWLRAAGEQTLAALRARGDATAAELAKDVPALRQKVTYGQGTKWAGELSMNTRMLFLLAAEGRVVRGRPLGTWRNSQYRWAPVEAWLPGGIEGLDPAAARAELARRWLRAFGPATVADLKWWTGWTVGLVKQALAEIDPVEVDLDGVPGIVLGDDVAPVKAPTPWVALLPALDSTTMGWTARDWYLGPHRSALFDRSGNAGPTVWSDGRVVGGWAQRSDGEVVVRFLEDVGRDVSAAVERESDRLQQWLGSTRVIPRFRTPLEHELSA